MSRKTLPRKFIAGVVTTALMIAMLGNAPARADEDLARALAAAVGVAIVGKIIAERVRETGDDDFDDIATRRYDTSPRDGWVVSPRDDRAGRRVEPRPLDRSLLPGDCLRSFETRDGRYRIFGERCLRENYAYTRRLPRACEVSFRANRTTQTGYDAHCLRRAGYQLARR